MRSGSVSALVLAAFALAACEGTPTTGSSASNATLDLCGLNCPDPVIAGNPTPPAPPVDPTAPPNTNTGNQTKLTTGDTTIVLESAVLKSPANGSLSKLTQTAGTPNTAKIEIDTKTSNNKNWPKPKILNEYVFGSGSGLGSTDYMEYRKLDTDENGVTLDETLQVWNWTNSYGTQYREVAGGGDARRQAWSFGGNRTTVMPGGGTANYTGRFGATANTWNWIENSNVGKTVNANNVWRVEGTSNITADFDTRQLDGTLTPSTWTARQSTGPNTGAFLAVDATNPLGANFVGFMDDDVVLQGTITGNTVSGKASLDPANGWINGTNPMYAGFFGPTGPGLHEVTGVYNFVAASPEPIGGEPPINDEGRGFVHQSGVFHGLD
ncbi:MAG TPA: transferrin-binding protein-like solute binding protein [Aestuariivirga sp.]|nr:transferrin-binding protein-like solute binding protein [Aestuariivirga sp.]